jgi:hypothetical protein
LCTPYRKKTTKNKSKDCMYISIMGRSRKDPHSPHRGNFCRPERRGEKNFSDNSKCIRTSEGGRGLTSNFLRGGGMDVFWNDPFH